MANTTKDTRPVEGDEKEGSVTGAARFTEQPGPVKGHGVAEDLERVGIPVVNDPAPVAEADKTSAPGPYAGSGAPKLHDPPLRSDRPDAELAVSLAQGAGQHVPPDPATHDYQGKPKV